MAFEYWRSMARRTPLLFATAVVVAVVAALALTGCQPLATAGTATGDTSPTGAATAAPSATKALVASAAQANKQLGALSVAAAGSIQGYNRDDFATWASQGHGCDTRDIVLERQGRNVVVGADCKISSGTWVSPYNGKTYTKPSQLQIDHLVPLGNAYESGAKSWSTAKKKAFANDLTDHQLIAVDISDNERKGDKDPSQWRPPNKGFWCTYAEDWISVKTVWHLTVTSSERGALGEMLATCT